MDTVAKTPAPEVSPAAARAAVPPAMPTPALISVMLAASKQVSDLIFSPGRAPQVELNGQLVEVIIPGLAGLTP